MLISESLALLSQNYYSDNKNNKKVTHSIVALLKDLMCQQFQRSTVDSRLGSQVALDGVVGLPAVSWASMKDHFPLDGTSFWVPDKHTHTKTKHSNAHACYDT